MADPVALAQALIRCRSVTPAEGGALDLAAGLLAEAGFTVHRPVFSEPGAPDVHNLYATLGSGRPCLVFAGHTDVVPPGDEAAWRHDPFGGIVEEGWLHGRGAADMKGGVAAMLAAALDWAARRDPAVPGQVAILLTGDEEGPAVNGTIKLLRFAAELGARFDACLLGEPTNPERLGDMAKIGRRGSLTGRIAVSGTQGHVAYPDLARNPIPDLLPLLAALGDPLDAGTEHFAASHLEITSVDVGNPATNVIPGEARAVFNIRFNDRWTAATLSAAIRSRIERASRPGARVALTFAPSNSPAFLTAPGPFVSLVSEAVEAATGRKPVLSTSGGTSDARFIKDYCPVVEFGLVGQTMHGTDERVATADIIALTAIYADVIHRFFAASPSSDLR